MTGWHPRILCDNLGLCKNKKKKEMVGKWVYNHVKLESRDVHIGNELLHIF